MALPFLLTRSDLARHIVELYEPFPGLDDGLDCHFASVAASIDRELEEIDYRALTLNDARAAAFISYWITEPDRLEVYERLRMTHDLADEWRSHGRPDAAAEMTANIPGGSAIDRDEVRVRANVRRFRIRRNADLRSSAAAFAWHPEIGFVPVR